MTRPGLRPRRFWTGWTCPSRAARSWRWWPRRGRANRRCCISRGCWTRPIRGVCVIGRDMTGLPDRGRTEARRQEVGFIYQFHHLLPEFSAARKHRPAATGQRRGRTRCRGAGRHAAGPCRSDPSRDHRPARCRAENSSAWPFAGRWPTGRAVAGGRTDGQPGPRNLGQVFDALMALVRETGLSALIATHNLALAARMDRVVRLARS